MKIFWLYAHPESRSLNGALKDEGVRALEAEGHEVRVSDLYAMKWNPVVDADDYGHDRTERLDVARVSQQAFESGRLAPDVVAEQEKIDWADAVIVQFPLWWYGMPAILKGWFDRVFVKGFGYGVLGEDGRTLRYGEGRLAGKRAMVVLTAGAFEPSLGPRGINGSLESVLYPLQHGTFWYTGMSVLPPYLVPAANRVSPEQYAAAASGLRERLRTLATTPPLPYRTQNGGDYDEDLVLRDNLAPGRTDLAIHRSS
ncbi:NADPH:quinone reductase [Streptomyces sp. Ru73]|uniref:NAD(P)H-dependent oxidoreductase n=1 Tax=Streptomyces sp. Ru73 TaxID=2080748 RepID=UPI000CDD467D|nr:NAD(P)H-dependent oxidoreductase [Streptomyces sp. Ru73]POX37809.1 NADPH:quinone reductase [Streptomyces sp. Ru73]